MDHYLDALSLWLLSWTTILLCCKNINDKSKPQAHEISLSVCWDFVVSMIFTWYGAKNTERMVLRKLGALNSLSQPHDLHLQLVDFISPSPPFNITSRSASGGKAVLKASVHAHPNPQPLFLSIFFLSFHPLISHQGLCVSVCEHVYRDCE